MTGRTRRADVLLSAAGVGLPCLAFLLGTATAGKTLQPDAAGLGISVGVVVASIATCYGARRWRGNFEEK